MRSDKNAVINVYSKHNHQIRIIIIIMLVSYIALSHSVLKALYNYYPWLGSERHNGPLVFLNSPGSIQSIAAISAHRIKAFTLQPTSYQVPNYTAGLTEAQSWFKSCPRTLATQKQTAGSDGARTCNL